MKTVAILDEILLTILLFSYYNRIYRVYSNLQNMSYLAYAKNQDIKSRLGSYDVVH